MSLSVVKGVFAQGNPPSGVALSGSLGIGQVSLLFVGFPGAVTGSVADNVNAGNYSLLCSSVGDSTGDMQAIYWKTTNAVGTPTITITSPGGFTFIWGMGVTGFLGTPTSDAGIQNTATGTGTALAINATSNFKNEIMLMNCNASAPSAVSANSWSLGTTGTSSTYNAFYAIENTPTANNFSGTVASETWHLQLAGIYDPGLLDAGHLPYAGPGISPDRQKTFFLPIRDTTRVAGGAAAIAGLSASTSTSFGNLTATGAMAGLSTSTSISFGQLTGTGNMPGLSASVSVSFGTLSQPVTGAYIPKGGPGISPSSMFQFSTLELDQTIFQNISINGLSASTSAALGQLTGAGALSGVSASVSTSFGNLTAVGGVGALTGLSAATSISFGRLTAGGPGQMQGLSVSTSISYGNLVGLPPPSTTGVCTNLWSADGNFKWSADGYPGISADGYEPTPLQCAVTYFSAVGVNVGSLTYQYSPYGVPIGWVITGYVPFINVSYAGQYIPLIISEGPPPQPQIITVPNVVGMFYYDAQQALLHAGFRIDEPIWGFAPMVSQQTPVVTIDSTLITIDSTLVTIDGFNGTLTAAKPVLPQYVYNQTIAAGVQFTQSTLVQINVQGFKAVMQPGIIIPVP